jgi:predicted nucleic acid-binding protein
LERLELSGIVFDAASAWAVLQRALSLARSHALTAYDASYLELALRLGAGLATFDRKLAVAARSVGVPVFGDAG